MVRIKALQYLREKIHDRDDLLEANIHRTSFHNPWFTKENYWKRLDELSLGMLDENILGRWTTEYRFPVDDTHQKKVGVVFGSEIPLIGFHDFLMVYLSGHQGQIRLSPEDPYVFPVLLQYLKHVDSTATDQIRVLEQFENFDAVIANGMSNTHGYFQKYLGKYPSVLREKRTSVAIVDGSEDEEDLTGLARDVFDYFGMGIRNVSKVYVPENYDFKTFLKQTESFSHLRNHHNYKNNYDYHLSVELLNQTRIIYNDYLILKPESENLKTPVGVLYYEEYKDLDSVRDKLAALKSEIYAIVGWHEVEELPGVTFGKTQISDIFDDPDHLDTGEFLLNI